MREDKIFRRFSISRAAKFPLLIIGAADNIIPLVADSQVTHTSFPHGGQAVRTQGKALWEGFTFRHTLSSHNVDHNFNGLFRVTRLFAVGALHKLCNRVPHIIIICNGVWTELGVLRVHNFGAEEAKFEDDTLDIKMGDLLLQAVVPTFKSKLGAAVLVFISSDLSITMTQLTEAPPGSPLSPPVEPINTTVPDFFPRKCGSTACVVLMTPKKLVSN